MTRLQQKHHQAFTLIEVLIALVIFAILGVMMAVMMRNTIYANQAANRVNQHIQHIEIAQALMRRDLSQVVDRSITDANGGVLAAFMLSNNQMSFTCGGYMNPFNLSNHSDLQRIDYRYQNQHLYRYSWPVLDRVLSATTPTKMELLDDVISFQVSAYDSLNHWQAEWPVTLNNTLSTSNTLSSHLPRAVKITLTLKNDGVINLWIVIPSRGMNE